MASNPDYFEYRTDYRLCWVKETASDDMINIGNWGYLWGWLFIYSSTSLLVLLYVWGRLRTGSARKTLQTRKAKCEQTALYVVAFTGFCFSLGLVWGLAWLETVHGRDPQDGSVSSLYHFHISLTCIYIYIYILYSLSLAHCI